MVTITLRSGLRLVALALALGCGWVAIATEQKAHVPVCYSPYRHGQMVRLIPCQQIHVAFRVLPVGSTWLVGPTIAMSFAIIVALALALVAISPRQGSLLAYRWRRAVY
jgi:predicted outer membrane lipoprotein